MATDTSKVYVPSAPDGVKGIIYRAPLGTTLPTDAKTALASAYKDLGGISDAGITNAQSRETKDIKDFMGDDVASPQSSYTETLEVEFLESTNLEVLKTVFGDSNVSFTAATTTAGAQIIVDHNSKVLPKSVYVLDTVYGAGMRRQIAPLAQPTTVGDVVQVNTDVVKYKVTFKCFKYIDTVAGKTFNVREILDDGTPDPDATP